MFSPYSSVQLAKQMCLTQPRNICRRLLTKPDVSLAEADGSEITEVCWRTSGGTYFLIKRRVCVSQSDGHMRHAGTSCCSLVRGLSVLNERIEQTRCVCRPSCHYNPEFISLRYFFLSTGNSVTERSFDLRCLWGVPLKTYGKEFHDLKNMGQTFLTDRYCAC